MNKEQPMTVQEANAIYHARIATENAKRISAEKLAKFWDMVNKTIRERVTLTSPICSAFAIEFKLDDGLDGYIKEIGEKFEKAGYNVTYGAGNTCKWYANSTVIYPYIIIGWNFT